ncbi:MAG: neutral zinc metallopeptidase [Chloroflexota bacterium]|nr:neutral zinc metallopeptidase [Chloroflexota bacterium]
MKPGPCWQVRLVLLPLALSMLIPLTQVVSAQSGGETGVDGAAYTSPTFGYSLEWDEEIWTVTDEYTETGYDFLQLSSDGANLYVEGVYFYQGDPDACLEGEQRALADDIGADALDPLLDDDGQPIGDSDNGWAYGLFSYPVSDDNDEFENVVYLECQTLVPDSSVLILTGFVDPDDAETQLEYIYDAVETLSFSADDVPELNSGDLEQSIRAVYLDVDNYWEGIFAAYDATYARPAYITYFEGIETDCGDAMAGEDGPFYCPSDQTVYLDLIEMENGELPFGFIVIQMVIAHEIGHHVQEIWGLTGCKQQACGEDGSSLAIELQADCLSGAWMQDAADRDLINQADLRRLKVAVNEYLADPPGTRADDPEAHGDGKTRFKMFMTGYQSGAEGCSIR